jgi:hypothetical protein
MTYIILYSWSVLTLGVIGAVVSLIFYFAAGATHFRDFAEKRAGSVTLLFASMVGTIVLWPIMLVIVIGLCCWFGLSARRRT